ncbi:hypothetical protein [Acetobacter persici]|uniref:hypothetical protein n=1 Tax=Acetobacter persici TaxID=1076596 RepID=UPI0039EB9E66
MIDKIVLVFKAKSAKISPAACRGAVSRLKDALNDLVVDPSLQSLCFKAKVENANKLSRFWRFAADYRMAEASETDILLPPHSSQLET